MKNGEEVVSVGGAVDASMKNIGTSATNSVLLDLSKAISITNILMLSFFISGGQSVASASTWRTGGLRTGLCGGVTPID